MPYVDFDLINARSTRGPSTPGRGVARIRHQRRGSREYDWISRNYMIVLSGREGAYHVPRRISGHEKGHLSVAQTSRPTRTFHIDALGECGRLSPSQFVAMHVEASETSQCEKAYGHRQSK